MTKIEWTDRTWNITVGCGKVSPGCERCLAPDTPVLTLNGEYRPIGDLSVGDVLLAFDDDGDLTVGQNRAWRSATVLANDHWGEDLLYRSLPFGRLVVLAWNGWQGPTGAKVTVDDVQVWAAGAIAEVEGVW